MAIKIRTGSVSEAANYVSAKSTELKRRFNDLNGIYTRQRSCWSSAAGDAALQRFRALLNSNGDPRGPALDRFVGFMRVQVGEGYEQTESAVSTAADKFK